MAVTYGASIELQRAYKYVALTDTYTLLGGINATENIDYFPDSGVAVGDAIMFGSQSNSCRQFYQLNFNILTPISAVGFDGVWEYARRDGGNYTTPTWHTLENVYDGTNKFQNAGNMAVSFKVPRDWENYIYPNASTIYYAFWVRFRVTAITSITEGGKQGSVPITCMHHCLTITSAYTLDTLYAALNSTVYNIASGFSTALDPLPLAPQREMRAGDNKTLGGDSKNIYIFTYAQTMATATVRITGLDLDGNVITEDVVLVLPTGTKSYLTKVYADITTVQLVTWSAAGMVLWILEQKGSYLMYKQGRQYMIDANLQSTSIGALSDTSKQLYFNSGYGIFDFVGLMTFGEVTAGGRGYNGVDILHESINNSIVTAGSWGKQDSAFMGSTCRVALGGASSHGYWQPPGLGSRIKLNDFYSEGNRQNNWAYKDTIAVNTRHYKQHGEPYFSILDGLTNYGPGIGWRASSHSGHILHRCDFSGVEDATVNPWQPVGDGWHCKLVDSKWGTAKSEPYQIAWRHASVETNHHVDRTISAEIRVTDPHGTPLDFAHVVITNVFGDVVLDAISNVDGYVGMDGGIATSGTTTSLVDTSKSWLVDLNRPDLDEWWKREILITGGTGAGQRRICQYNHSSTNQKPHIDFETAPDNTSRYIIVPYIDIVIYSPITYETGYTIGNADPQGPFKFKVTCSGYETFEETLDIGDGAMIKDIPMKPRRQPNR